jgi:hypothetical protein
LDQSDRAPGADRADRLFAIGIVGFSSAEMAKAIASEQRGFRATQERA